MESYKQCCCFTRNFRLSSKTQPPNDVKEMFNEYAQGEDYMTAEQLQRFLQEAQPPTGGVDDAGGIVEQVLKVHHYIAKFKRKSLTLDDFFFFLFSVDLNPPLNPQVHQDMSAPLAHYFMFTGHNSYLTGNQLWSRSCIKPIISALRRGVRVIELDLWPTRKGNGVRVVHGGTLTSSVCFRKCLVAIKDNAFYASEYPVIITFEDHLESSVLHQNVAEMVSNIFGDMLFPNTDLVEFPSPESLKKRILISTKPPRHYPTKQESDGKKPEDATNSTVQEKGGADDIKKLHSHTVENEMDEQEEDVDCETDEIPEYHDIIAIHAVKLSDHKLEDLLKHKSKTVARLSLSEDQLKNAVGNHAGTDVVRFTQRNLLRIYPKGTRIDSSNYNPLTGWTHGAQMIAFNMQGHGKHLWVMQGMFRANGGCGYIKKPDVLLKENEVFDPKRYGTIKKTLKVKVYMGGGWRNDFRKSHFDPFSPPDFFTKLEILGAKADEKKVQTKTIMNHWAPTWDEEFEFPLTVPEMALLRIEVCESDNGVKDDFGGQTCLSVTELISGIRAIPLYDIKGEKYRHVKLLMRFQFIDQ